MPSCQDGCGQEHQRKNAQHVRGLNPWNGNMNPVTLVSTVVHRNQVAQLCNCRAYQSINNHETGELKLRYRDGKLAIEYFESSRPLAPRTYRSVLGHRIGRLRDLLDENSSAYQEYQGIVAALSAISDRDTFAEFPIGGGLRATSRPSWCRSRDTLGPCHRLRPPLQFDNVPASCRSDRPHVAPLHKCGWSHDNAGQVYLKRLRRVSQSR